MTLTDTAFQARRAIKFGGIFLVSCVVLIFSFRTVHSIYRHFFPAPPPPPEVRFGKLPQLIFEQKPGIPPLTYTLQTPTSDLPKLPLQTYVYFMPTPQSSFLNLDDAAKTARSLDFTVPGTALSEVIYRFSQSNIPETLDINIVNKTLSLSYNLAQDPEPLSLHPRSNEEALAAVRSFLNRAGLLSSDLEQGKPTFENLQSGAEALLPANSLSSANFIRVNLWRQDYNNMQVITSRTNRSNVWFLVSGANSGPKQIIAGEYHYFPISEDQKSTYPLKTADAAWKQLQEGRGLIISGPTSGSQVVVRRVYIAYYDSGKVQQFLEPVVVFDGDSGFRAIVPAVTDQWYGAQ